MPHSGRRPRRPGTGVDQGQQMLQVAAGTIPLASNFLVPNGTFVVDTRGDDGLM